ncbi:MAG: cytochrome c [Myxococcales bacterium]|nr:cytochrome c [Myxococcales bacterium]
MGLGLRRTQSLRGGLLGTEPFHWSGDMNTLDALLSDVQVNRMGGAMPTVDEMNGLRAWVNTLRAPAASPPASPAAVQRGVKLFQGAGCVGCHDVGTGGAFQVPSLVGVAWRAPFLHHGCAKTLRDRFSACGGGDKHGQTSSLSQAQVSDLVAYLETL